MKKILFISLVLLAPLCSCQRQIVTKDYTVVSIEPFYSQARIVAEDSDYPIPSGFDNYADLVKGAGDSLANKFNSVTYLEDNIHKDTNYTHEIVGSLNKNQIIIIEGHGSCEWQQGEARSVIWNKDLYDNSKASEYDYYNNLIIEAGGFEGITSDYFDKYCTNSLDGSIIYLNCCFSGRDSTLAKFFLDKGASTVIGNTCAVTVPYGNIIEYTTIKLLGEVNPKTNNLYTAYEALEKAKEIYGRNNKLTGAESILFGNPNFSLAK